MVHVQSFFANYIQQGNQKYTEEKYVYCSPSFVVVVVVVVVF